MLRLATCSLLLSSFLIGIQGLEDAKDPLHNTATVAIGKHYYTVSKGKAFVSIVSNNPVNKFCERPIPTDNDFLHAKGPLQATVSGDGKIIAWARLSTDLENDEYTKTKHLVMIVDPLTCDFVIPEILVEYSPVGWNSFEATVVAYKDYFDVFFPSQRKCFPCRYDTQGYALNISRQFPVHVQLPSHPYHIKAIMDSSYTLFGYIYVYNMGKEKSIAQVIYPDFIIGKQKHFKHPILAVAARADDFTRIGMCYEKYLYGIHPKDRKLVCEQFDSQLSPIENSKSEEFHFGEIVRPGLMFDNSNNLYIAIDKKSNKHENGLTHFEKLKVHHIGAGGKTKTILSKELTSDYLSIDLLKFKDQHVYVATVHHEIESNIKMPGDPEIKTKLYIE